MTLPAVALDGRSFEDLIAEGRRRVMQACPEWVANGGPDPGETLIELFAWMSGLAVERLTRAPDKLHVALLEMLGIELHGPTAARTLINFGLSAPPEQPLEIPAGTEVGTLRTATEESIVFQVESAFTIPAARPVAYAVQRDGGTKQVGVAEGVARPSGPDQLAFGRPPQVGDALYLGFEESLGRLALRVSIEASMARGAGVNPEDPPLRWEVSQGNGGWAQAEVVEDRTGGFNYGSGTVRLLCPASSGVEPLAGRRLHWLRCRIADRTRHGNEPTIYTHPPEIYTITADPIGALLPAEHSTGETNEELGVSDGSPGQVFALRFSPVLTLEPGETLEAQRPDGQWDEWVQRDSFADSGPDDNHFTIDLVHGQIHFGPGLRGASGGTSQRGAIPPKGSALRISYRYGGGRVGNVAAGTLTTLRSAIPGIATVSNPSAALGGVDSQALESARERAALEIRTRYRAVTAEDYEFLAGEASPRVARAIAVPSDENGGVRLRILPRVDPADRRLTIEQLTPDERLLEEVARYLQARSLVGCPLELLPVRFRGVSVVVNLQAEPRADLQRIEDQVRRALYTYLSPLIGGFADGAGAGWPFGRSLNQGELYAIVHSIAGVEFVRILRLYEMDLATGEQSPKPVGRQVALEPDEVIASGEHMVRVVPREE
jgi:predicted phage baseplate assembly protein